MGDPYELAPGVNAPDLPGRVVLRESVEDTLDAAASELFVLSLDCVRAFGDFHLALSVSPSLEGLFQRLMVDPKFRTLPWSRTHLWLACETLGERAGAFGRELRELVIEHAGIPDGQAHLIPTDDDDAARAYAGELRETLAWREPGHDRLDASVLALDDPITGVDPAQTDELVVAGEDGVVRLSRRLINASRMIGVLGTGAPAFACLGAREDDSHAFGLEPIGGELKWFLDHAACAGASP